MDHNFSGQKETCDLHKVMWDFVDDVDARWKKMSGYLDMMASIRDEIDEYLSYFEEYRQGKNDGSQVDEYLGELQKCLAGLIAQESLLHNAQVNVGLYTPRPRSLYAQNRKAIEEQCFQVPGVQCVVDPVENALLVKMPPLLSTNRNYQVARGGYPFPAHTLAQFGVELKANLSKINDVLPRADRYHFSYLHIYSNSRSGMIDSDNRDTKQVTDTITEALGVTDHPLRVSFSARTVASDKLAEGSYVYVFGEFDNPPTTQKILNALERVFSGGPHDARTINL